MEIKDLPYSQGQDFPEIVVEGPNRYWVGILKNLYASCGSETSAVLQYIYQSYIIAPKEKEIAALLEKIAITEMRHHKQLGSAITALGGVPFYTNLQGMPFSVKCIYDGTNLKQMLLADIQAEEQSIKAYSDAIDKIDNESIQQLLTRIREDEKIHKQTLECLLEYVSFYK